jgi:hypothetical protein
VYVAHGGSVEKELTAFVERRDGQRRKSEGERPVEEAWMESERGHGEKRRRENRAAWYGWHLDRAVEAYGIVVNAVNAVNGRSCGGETERSKGGRAEEPPRFGAFLEKTSQRRNERGYPVDHDPAGRRQSTHRAAAAGTARANRPEWRAA